MKKNLLSLTVIICSMMNCQTSSEDTKLMRVAEFGKSMAIGLSVNSENRVFVSFPDYNGNGNLALTEIIDGKPRAYPDTVWNTKGDYPDHFLRVQDLFVDAQDFLWVLDSKAGSAGNGQAETQNRFKLVKINTRTNQVEDTFLFEDLDKSKSSLNDVRVDVEKQFAYLSDPGAASVVVLDLQTKKSRSLLAHTPFTLADKITLEYRGVPMQDKDGNPFSSHINSIALTHDFRYFYFKPINKQNLYRIETRYLADPALTDEDLALQVEDMGNVGITHGLIADAAGNIFLTTSESYSVSYLTPGGQLKTLVRDPRLLWPDSFGIGSDGYLYFTCAQLQRLPQWNNGKDRTVYPYQAFKIKLPVNNDHESTVNNDR